MKIKVKVIPKSSCNKISHKGDVFKIKITDVPEKGRANDKIIKLLAKEFGVSKLNIEIVRGLTKKDKIVQINN